jgi:hypothetical protein
MNCFRECLLRNWWVIAIATLLGIAVGAVLEAFLACLIAEGIITIASGGGFIWVGGTVTIACMLAMLPLSWLGALIGALAGLIIGSAITISECGAICSTEVQAGVPNVDQGLTGLPPLFGSDEKKPIGCESATEALSVAQQELGTAVAERNRRRQELEDCEAAARRARTAFTAAVAALAAAPFWDPWAVAAALAVVAVASANWVYKQSLVEAARVALAAAQAAVMTLEGAVAVAQAAKDAACGKQPKNPPGPVTPPRVIT